MIRQFTIYHWDYLIDRLYGLRDCYCARLTLRCPVR